MKTVAFLLGLSALILAPMMASSTSVEKQPEPLPISTCAAQAPYGMPSDSHPHAAYVCRSAYVLQADLVAKIPVWVTYTLTPDHTVGCVKRSNAFEADQSLPEDERAAPSDYVKSGYDIGHQANDADMDWDVSVERQSFILTNMAPQYPALNRGIWKVLETDVRAWAHAGHPMTIYVGPIWTASDPTIGANKVVAAGRFYKIIIDDTTKQSLAFVMPNLKTDQGDDIAPFQTTVANIESLTNVTFSVPDSKTAKNAIWPVDVKKQAKDKKAACSKS